MPEKKAYHFIVGIQRSGTTLLSYLLNKNPHILALPESKHAIKLINSYKKNNPETIIQYLIKNKASDQRGPYTIDIHALEEVINDTILDRDLKVNLINIAQAFTFTPYPDKKNLSIYIDKNPSYTRIINQIHSVLPDSKFIFCTRDYRAFYYSRVSKKNPNAKSNNIYYLSNIWNSYHQIGLSFAEKHPNNILFCKYEDLTSNTEASMTNISNFLGIPYNKEMSETNFDFEKVIKNEESSRRKTKFKDLSQPVQKDRIDSWRKNLSEQQIKILDYNCSETANKFNYLPIYTKFNKIERIKNTSGMYLFDFIQKGYNKLNR